MAENRLPKNQAMPPIMAPKIPIITPNTPPRNPKTNPIMAPPSPIHIGKVKNKIITRSIVEDDEEEDEDELRVAISFEFDRAIATIILF